MNVFEMAIMLQMSFFDMAVIRIKHCTNNYYVNLACVSNKCVVLE